MDMKLAVSNIAWESKDDGEVYGWMKKLGFSGLEIAPTRLFPENPYKRTLEAERFADKIWAEYGFAIPSMQSIWYGRTERLFGEKAEREALLAYTKEAIEFAGALRCGNLVFGCPRNRNMPEGACENDAVDFFRQIGDYAAERKTRIGLEANPPIYHTNFINTTRQALEYIEMVGSEGVKLNLDMGTMIQNGESVDVIRRNVSRISHVHISEPGLKMICERGLLDELLVVLKEENYQGFVSIEMARQEKLSDLLSVMEMISFKANV